MNRCYRERILYFLTVFLLPVYILCEELIIDPSQVDSKSKIPPSNLPKVDGRAFTGYSEFTVKIDPKNQGVLLRRKFDKNIENQKGLVYVNGANAGEWFTPGKPQEKEVFIAESEFVLPESLTKGKDAITIRIRYGGGSVDWNEFSYQILSKVGGQYNETDTLDIRNSASEKSHKYIIDKQTWEGEREIMRYLTNVVLPINKKKQVEGDLVFLDGRAFKGSSEFTVRIAPDNDGVLLRRAYHKIIPNQKGVLSVNGARIGEWFEKGGGNDIADTNFLIPARYARGNSYLKVKVTFLSSDNDWNEFHYWVFSKKGGEFILTDSLDVGNTRDEKSHGYKIEKQTWNSMHCALVINSDINFPREENANIFPAAEHTPALSVVWLTKHEEAQALSRTSQRPLLMIFYNPSHATAQWVDSLLFNNSSAEPLLR
ncbi:hypothetical protein JW926_03855, partial [Candidatus Sumerlaeota bacterium]|nr:hypothetical protein [Candidatus Sumerlaeota bacterium]